MWCEVFFLNIFYLTYSEGEQQFLDLDEKLNRLAKFAPHLWKDDVSHIFYSISI